MKGFASIAQRKGASFSWSGECDRAFKELRQRLCESPILSYPAFDNPFVLETDASIKGNKQTANYILLRLQVVLLTLPRRTIVSGDARCRLVHSSLQNVPVWSEGDHLH